jgi:hypothetical protein
MLLCLTLALRSVLVGQELSNLDDLIDSTKMGNLATVVAEPLIEYQQAPAVANLSTECITYTKVVALLYDQAPRPRLHQVWSDLKAATAEPVSLLQRIVQIENRKPGKLAAATSLIDTIKALGAASDNAEKDKNLMALLEVNNAWTASKSAREEFQAEQEVNNLKVQYRISRTKQRETIAPTLCLAASKLVPNLKEFGYTGIGIKSDSYEIIAVFEPAASAGVKVGDVIQMINGHQISSNTSRREVMDRINGPRNNFLQLGLTNKNGLEHTVVITRSAIPKKFPQFFDDFSTAATGATC